MLGGSTLVEVAREIGIEAHGLDLSSGFNILKAEHSRKLLTPRTAT